MTTQEVVDRLTIQIESLQDGFELLSKAPNLKELGKSFFHLLRGNVTAVDGFVLFRNARETAWERLFGKGDATAALECVGGSEVSNAFSFHSLKDRPFAVVAVHSLHDGSHIALVLGRKLDKSGYSRLDSLTVQMLIQLFANAYQSLLQRQKEKGLVFSLNHRLLQLNSLIDTGIQLSRFHQETSLHHTALERAAALTNASYGSVTISSGWTRKERIVFPENIALKRPKDASHRIRAAFKFSGQTYAYELFDKESRTGTGPFEETDRLLLDSLARQVHAVLENHYLHLQEVEKQKIERDIAVAASIQQRILPKSLPVIPGYDLFGTNIPTRFVGGDYYDCIALNDGRFALIMADVSGKGVPAALLVSSFHAYLSAYVDTGLSIVDLARRLNAVIYGASTEERYITAVLAYFTPATGDVEFVNAGHTPVYLRRSGGAVEDIADGGLALGMIDMDFPYTSARVTISAGEQLLLYTDGVTEAMNSKEQLYDATGALKKFMESFAPQTAESFISGLLADLSRFTGSAPQNDDITAMYVMRL